MILSRPKYTNRERPVGNQAKGLLRRARSVKGYKKNAPVARGV